MPTNRKYRGHRVQALTPIELEHLACGGWDGHLLAPGPDGCRLCRDGMVRADWEQGREAVMADWQRLDFPYLPLGAILFDGEKFPPLDPRWRDLYRSIWKAIAFELDRGAR